MPTTKESMKKIARSARARCQQAIVRCRHLPATAHPLPATPFPHPATAHPLLDFALVAARLKRSRRMALYLQTMVRRLYSRLFTLSPRFVHAVSCSTNSYPLSVRIRRGVPCFARQWRMRMPLSERLYILSLSRTCAVLRKQCCERHGCPSESRANL